MTYYVVKKIENNVYELVEGRREGVALIPLRRETFIGSIEQLARAIFRCKKDADVEVEYVP